LAAAGCGAASRPQTTQTVAVRHHARATPKPGAPPLVLAGTAALPAPVQAPATTSLADRAVLIGGLDQADVSVVDVISADSAGAQRIGSLPIARHDAAAATLGDSAYVIGGGEPSFDQIDKVDASGTTSAAGRLPVPASDVAAATVGSRIYVVGGYTGTVPLDTIVAWSGSGTGKVVARLPQPVRYAAVAADGGRLIIAGGTNGITDTRAVYAFDPSSGQLTRVGELPEPTAHAAAATLGDAVYVLGGRGPAQGSQSSRIVAVNPATDKITRAGRLPIPLSDAGATTLAGRILLAGGREPDGTLSDHVYMLAPR
jgi:N-acetylneuraminic acid mutarotase